MQLLLQELRIAKKDAIVHKKRCPIVSENVCQIYKSLKSLDSTLENETFVVNKF